MAFRFVRTEDAVRLFHESTVYSDLASEYMRLNGTEWLRRVLRNPMKKLLEHTTPEVFDSYTLTPSGGGARSVAFSRELTQLVDEIIAAFMEDTRHVPRYGLHLYIYICVLAQQTILIGCVRETLSVIISPCIHVCECVLAESGLRLFLCSRVCSSLLHAHFSLFLSLVVCSAVRHALSLLSDAVDAKFQPANRNAAIAGLLLFRFVCPAIADPVRYKLVKSAIGTLPMLSCECVTLAVIS
ncbi:MAG: hypothetical protein H0V43_01835 [Gemmatimonadales bacterium]|nr:hypothetical protein [Gemmatimonadales bacterium]